MAKKATPQKRTPLRVVDKAPPAPAAAKSGRRKAAPETNIPAADRETYHYHLGLIRRQQDKIKLEAKELKARRRAAQDAGINLGDLDRAIAWDKQEPETVQASIKRQLQYIEWMGLAPGVQGNLFEVAAKNQDSEKRAEDEGYVEGLEGAVGVMPVGDRYDASNPLGQARMRGWNRGQAVVLNRFSEAAQAKNAAEAKAKADAEQPIPAGAPQPEAASA